MEDEVLLLNFQVARVAAVGFAGGIGGERVVLGVVVEQRIAPTAALRKTLAVLLDDERLGEDVRYIDDERRLRALLRLPLKLRDLRSIREGLAIARDAG